MHVLIFGVNLSSTFRFIVFVRPPKSPAADNVDRLKTVIAELTELEINRNGIVIPAGSALAAGYPNSVMFDTPKPLRQWPREERQPFSCHSARADGGN